MKEGLVDSWLETAPKTSGVVLIAIGDIYYMHLAVNNCVSLKSHAEKLSVTLVTTKETVIFLEDYEKTLFDHIVFIDSEKLNGIRGYDVFRSKLFLDQLTPYDLTLYIDVDTIWNNDHSIIEFIKSFDGIDFTCGNRGRMKTGDNSLQSRWTDLAKIKELYNIDENYDVTSEVIFFNKNTKVFEQARKVYNDLRIETNKFGKGFPDEVWIMIAIEQLKIKLHQSPYYPTYWEPHYFNDRVKSKSESEIRQFKILSVGGAFTATKIRRLYMNMAGAAYYQMGLNRPAYFSDPLRPFNKSQVLAERRMI